LTIRLKREARADLLAVRAWSETHWGPAQTRDYLAGFKAALEQLDQNPYLGRPRDVFARGLRSWVDSPYVIFYLARDDGVSIVRVFHERRNQAALDFSEVLEADDRA
jgi:plasmid stabilization system protein ParE